MWRGPLSQTAQILGDLRHYGGPIAGLFLPEVGGVACAARQISNAAGRRSVSINAEIASAGIGRLNK
jgi:hypothetical protein